MLHTYVLVINEHFFESHKIAEGQQHFEHFAYQLVLAIPVCSITQNIQTFVSKQTITYMYTYRELTNCLNAKLFKHRKVPEKQKNEHYMMVITNRD